MASHSKLPKLPRFQSEGEEAQWRFDHRDELGEDLVVAMEERGIGESSAMRRARKLREMGTTSAA